MKDEWREMRESVRSGEMMDDAEHGTVPCGIGLFRRGTCVTGRYPLSFHRLQMNPLNTRRCLLARRPVHS